MANIITTVLGYFRFGGNPLAAETGLQSGTPSASLAKDVINVGPESALQISTIWACIDRRATTIASLPLFVYDVLGDKKTLARTKLLYQLLHDSPNDRMTSFEFWRAMIMYYDLRGNAYARIDRNASGDAIALWPMPSDQVQPHILDDGTMVYVYRVGNDVAVLAARNVLVLKNLGNGSTGLAKLEFMRAATSEAAYGQQAAINIFANGGKPTGVLMTDSVLADEQREKLRAAFSGMGTGSTQKLYVLEASMKYEQISITPEQQQLLESRKYSVEELCRWFDVPPVLVHHSNVTAWGSGIEQIVDGFYKFSVRPMLVNIEQALRKRVMTPQQRASMVAEFSFDALLRGNAKDRFEIYAKAVQNGLKTRNECRQLENDAPIIGGDELTAQSNLAPLNMLGKISNPGGSNADMQNVTAQ